MTIDTIMQDVPLGDFPGGGVHPHFLIAGPCVIESEQIVLDTAFQVAEIARSVGFPYLFKSSYDKANRSSIHSYRGPGIEEGLAILQKVKEQVRVPVLTDVHSVEEVRQAAQVVDVVQIPAFLCRQTDLLRAAGATGKVVNVKKGQWMSSDDMRGAVEKVRSAGAPEVVVTERGTFFGYGNLVVDMRSFRRIRRACQTPTLFDGTHSVQRPGRADGSSGGDPEFIAPLVRAAVAAGCDGLFLETHPNPSVAPSDGSNMLPLDALRAVLEQALAVRSALAAPISSAPSRTA